MLYWNTMDPKTTLQAYTTYASNNNVDKKKLS